MERSFELTGKLSAVIAEIEHYETSTVAVDPDLLNAVADYIDSGVAATATLQKLRTALLLKGLPDPAQSGCYGSNNSDGTANLADDAGRQRALRILSEILTPLAHLNSLRKMKSSDSGGATLSRAWVLLGVCANPRPEDVRAAFCTRAVLTHPDRCSDPNAKERFQSLYAAYEMALRHSRQGSAASPLNVSGVAEFDWRGEVARVRAAYGAMRNHFDPRPPFAARRPCAHSASASTSVSASSSFPARPRPRAAVGPRGRKRAEAGAGEGEGVKAKESERARERAEGHRVTSAARRRGPARALRGLTRAAVAEAAGRRAVAVQEQWEWRAMAMDLVEGRIRHTVQALEVVARNVLYGLFDEDLKGDAGDASGNGGDVKRNGGLGITEVTNNNYLLSHLFSSVSN